MHSPRLIPRGLCRSGLCLGLSVQSSDPQQTGKSPLPASGLQAPFWRAALSKFQRPLQHCLAHLRPLHNAVILAAAKMVPERGSRFDPTGNIACGLMLATVEVAPPEGAHAHSLSCYHQTRLLPHLAWHVARLAQRCMAVHGDACSREGSHLVWQRQQPLGNPQMWWQQGSALSASWLWILAWALYLLAIDQLYSAPHRDGESQSRPPPDTLLFVPANHLGNL